MSTLQMKNQNEVYTLLKFKKLVELFVKNSSLSLYESVEDFLEDHKFLLKFENELKELINDDDIDGCRQFYHFQTLRNRVIDNIEIYENKNGIDSIRVKENALRLFLKNIAVTKKETEHEEE